MRNLPIRLCLTNMPKRKRDEVEDHDTIEKSLRAFILYGTKQLFRALKTAKGFERQKLGKRHKNAREQKQTGELSRLEKEIAVLKVRCSELANWT